MSENIYDLAHDLDKGIRETNEFKSLQEAYKNVNADEEAKTKFNRFREIQVTIQEKQMTGQPIDDETVDVAQKVAEEVQQNELIISLMEKEQAMSTIINDLNRIIMTPLQDLYEVEQGGVGWGGVFGGRRFLVTFFIYRNDCASNSSASSFAFTKIGEAVCAFILSKERNLYV
ncbi:hypothetical protein KKC_10277 [Listeria fleischmannii subsp. coloradonensis]|nr:hypothetical protein KKC_10277 [Listeria fleischmannii subsp. coloradonensis]